MGAHFGRRTASLPVSITSDVDHGQGCSVWAISASARTSERRSVVTTVTVNTRCYYTAKGYGDVVIFPGFHEDPARRAAVLQEHACEPKKGRVPGEDIVWHFCAGRSAPGGQDKVSLRTKESASETHQWIGPRLGHSALREGLLPFRVVLVRPRRLGRLAVRSWVRNHDVRRGPARDGVVMMGSRTWLWQCA